MDEGVQAGGRVSLRSDRVARIGLIVAFSGVGQNLLFVVSTLGLSDLPGINPDLTRGQSHLPVIVLGLPIVTWSCRARSVRMIVAVILIRNHPRRCHVRPLHQMTCAMSRCHVSCPPRRLLNMISTAQLAPDSIAVREPTLARRLRKSRLMIWITTTAGTYVSPRVGGRSVRE
jgi:hypothetical protein